MSVYIYAKSLEKKNSLPSPRTTHMLLLPLLCHPPPVTFYLSYYLVLLHSAFLSLSLSKYFSAISLVLNTCVKSILRRRKIPETCQLFFFYSPLQYLGIIYIECFLLFIFNGDGLYVCVCVYVRVRVHGSKKTKQTKRSKKKKTWTGRSGKRCRI